MTFKGQRVMLSPNLVAPEMLDMLRGALKDNGAEVCECADPSYNGSNDFHVLSSCDHEKFAYFQARGCNVVGPECVLRFSRERRPLPPARYTCCPALEGIRILATGFEGTERARIQHLVTSMCGELLSKVSMNVDFVVAKDVLAPKYKWSALSLRKPVVKIDWLVHCSREHRRVPHEPHKLPIFTGIKLCTTGILMDARTRIAKLVVENGGSLSADLTRDCTHLIAISSDSDKFKVAKQHWIYIKLVNENWFWNSISEQVCLEESLYPVEEGSNIHHVSGPISSVMSGPSNTRADVTQDRGLAGSVLEESRGDIAPSLQEGAQDQLGGISENSGELYLSGCRIHLIGFDSLTMRKLVTLIRNGGGTRHMEFNERITHVILGKPSESELKDLRQSISWGAVHVVFPTWLEECSRLRKEVAVCAQFAVTQTLLLQVGNMKDSVRMMGKQPLVSRPLPALRGDVSVHQDNTACEIRQDPLQQNWSKKMLSTACEDLSTKMMFTASEVRQDLRKKMMSSACEIRQDLSKKMLSTTSRQESVEQDLSKKMPDVLQQGEGAGSQTQRPINTPITSHAPSAQTTAVTKTAMNSSQLNSENGNKVFNGCVFGFAPSFQAGIRMEVVHWVEEGGGKMLRDHDPQVPAFLIVPHGPTSHPSQSTATSVTTQWIKYCLQEEKILDIDSHILFRPLSCDVPLSGFENFKFAVSQYADRERILLYNLCHVLGAKYQEKKMSRTATHLLCKVGDGDKYAAALVWSMEIVTAEWLYACVANNRVLPPDPYRPKRLTAADQDAGLAISTQYPSQFTSSEVGRLYVETQGNPLPSLPAQVTPPTQLELKKKMPTSRRKPNSRARPSPAAHETRVRKTSALSRKGLLSTHMSGNLDQWDELTASWAGKDLERQPSQQEVKTSSGGTQDMPVDPAPNMAQEDLCAGFEEAPNMAQDELCADLEEASREIKGDQGLENEDESGTDVASAIEGLLAQTRKAHSGASSLSSEGDHDHDLMSPEPNKMKRRNGEDVLARPNFKRPRLISTRSMGRSERIVATPVPDKVEDFEDPRLDSQVVAYDDDISEKKKIMERVRTRSMSGGSAEKKSSWKGTEFGRLLRAANANK